VAEAVSESRPGAGFWRDDLHPWLWLWFPQILIIFQYALYFYDRTLYRKIIIGEQALVELSTAVLALIAFLIGLRLLRRIGQFPGLVVRAWVVMVVLACLYFAGEEISWGQQLLEWETPQAIARLNDQSETNLHNMSSWFDQKPRMFLEIWVLVGGIFVPLLRRRGERMDPRTHWELDWRNWFWPTYVALPTALLAILIRLPERIKTVFDLDRLPFEIRYSEPQEYYFALFLLLYLASIDYRLRRVERQRRERAR
jgi:hypothetical protein